MPRTWRLVGVKVLFADELAILACGACESPLVYFLPRGLGYCSYGVKNNACRNG